MKQDLGPLGQIDLLTDRELRESLGHHFDANIRDWVRGIKVIRLPVTIGTSNGSGALSSVVIPGPQSGYVWDVRRITVTGPAVYNSAGGFFANLFRGNTTSEGTDINLMANLFAGAGATIFTKLSVVFFGGEDLIVSGGSGANNSQFLVSGQVTEVPAEMIGKLA